ncbi:peptidoglycan-recognition protein SD-like [Bacillus rossius redtenbacheri]|uniref:peptidoglycan-recognition protein SD-like n=1 Tax=Bacillus rossius redtenbacheri TaxID=93214 RepID=UPI002FDED509
MASASCSFAGGPSEDAHIASIGRCTAVIDDDGELVDESYPLLRRAHKSVLSLTFRVLLLFVLFATLFGGITVGIWLVIEAERLEAPVVSREEWGARPPVPGGTQPLPQFPARYVVVAHTASAPCDCAAGCAQAVRRDQNYFMDQLRYADVGYNFLVGGDGRVYEGRGFRTQGAFARHFNNRSLGVAFIGDFEIIAPPRVQLDAARSFLRHAVDSEQLAADYKLVAHRQVANTSSPGEQLAAAIRLWPHWDDCYRTC